MPTPAARQAEAILRDGGQYQWYVIPLFALIVLAYANEVEAKKWRAVFAGLAFWGMDWLNEVWNGLVYHFTRHAPIWGAPGKTAYLILVGLNVEICFMFAIAGLAFTKMLPEDRARKVLGVPNRLFVAAAGSAFCVLVEEWLHALGALTWDWPFWNARQPWLIFLVGYLPFFLVSFWVFDMPSVRRQARVTCAILGFDAVCLLVFGGVLRWI